MSRGRPPQKAPGGLTHVLFVRVDQTMLDALDKVRDVESQEHPGRVVSRADVVRELLSRGLKS